MSVIRSGRYEDISQVVKIYDRILTDEENGIERTGWVRGVYPTEETAVESLKAGALFVLTKDEVVVAAAKIDQVQLEEYKNVSWEHGDIPADQVMVLHTLVVDPAFSGKGCGVEFVKFYERYALENHCYYLRMDTNAKNTAARTLYKKMGYREAGIVASVFNGIPDIQLVCLEKSLK